MFTRRNLIHTTLILLFLFSAAPAQEKRPPVELPREPVASTPAPLVTATVTPGRVRFVSPGSVVQLRLEVYNEGGQKLFDTELRGGNVLDWHLLDGAAQQLPTGSYACVLTSKSLSGRLSQRVALVTVADKEVAIAAVGVAQISIAQQQAIGPVESSASVSVLPDSEAEPITTMTHDGAEGQITRTQGALSFRVGDLFSGKDKEQMRLTEKGWLGIGTSNPQASLDVAGTIRAERVLITKPAKPGSLEGDTLPAMDTEGAPQPLTSGSGTQNRIAKWTDNIGTLGDSGITETATGAVGIGHTDPQAALHVGQNYGYGSTTGLLIAPSLNGGQYNRAFQLAPRQTASLVTNSIMMYALPTVDAGVTVPGQFGIIIGGKLGAGTITSYAALATGTQVSLGATNNTHLLMGTSAIPAGNFAIFDNTGYKSFFKGNIGIGTIAPRSPLEVSGDVRLGSGGNLFATAGDENLRVVRGVIDSAGNILEGAGFSVFHSERGHYVIKFNSAFAGPPAVTATNMLLDESVAPRIIAVQTSAASNIILRQYCLDPNLCGDVDSPLHFIAIGPR